MYTIDIVIVLNFTKIEKKIKTIWSRPQFVPFGLLWYDQTVLHRAEKQRQFSSPATPKFEQSSAGYHRDPGRRRPSPVSLAFTSATGSTSIHRHSPAPPACLVRRHLVVGRATTCHDFRFCQDESIRRLFRQQWMNLDNTVFIRLIAARIIRKRLKKSGCASLFGCVYY